MVTIAITRHGEGTPYRFKSWDEADEHPLIQLGDPKMQGPSDLVANYSPRGELQALLERVARPQSKVLVPEDPGGSLQAYRRLCVDEAGEALWDAICRVSGDAPSETDEICRVVRADRIWTKKESIMAKNQAPENKDAGEAKEQKARTIGGKPVTAVLKFGKTPEGKEYNTGDNCPKREGTKSHARFQGYRAGQTIEQHLARAADAPEGNPNAADIAHDLGKGYIVAE